MKIIVSVLATITVAASFVVFLRWRTVSGETANAVERTFIEPGSDLFHVTELPTKFSKIIAVTDSIVLLKNDFTTVGISSAEGRHTDWHEKDIKKIYADANIRHIEDISFRLHDFIIFSGNTGSVFFTSTISQQSFSKKVELGFLYSQGIITDDNIGFFRKLDNTGKNSIFLKYDFNTYLHDDSVYLWPPARNDAGLASDGLFLYDYGTSLYYINYYNSDVYKLDTSLVTSGHFNTIDSTLILPHVIYTPTEHSYKFDSPHRIVNNAAAASVDNLYINSTIKTRNESLNRRKDHVIDVYRTVDGRYSFSFHIPIGYGWRIYDMKAIDNNRLAVLTEKALLVINKKG